MTKSPNMPCRLCDEEIYFDDNVLSQSGKKIPLESKNNEKHDCPNSPYKQKQQQKPKDTSKQVRPQGVPLDLTEINVQLQDIRNELREIHRVIAEYGEVIARGSFTTAKELEGTGGKLDEQEIE